MPSENNASLVPVNVTIESQLSKEAECNHYKQRFNSLKIVQEHFQNELVKYKNRCLGVDTMVLALKESKQENVKLSKHVRALETAISILQKRLDHNGLSISVNIQETELFVPGASKQTFANLAKETARLRALLRQENGLFGKKSANEIEDMKLALEDAEAENNQLKNKMKDMEMIKLKMISDYEAAIEKLTKEKQEERTKFEQEFKAREVKEVKEKERSRNEQTPVDSSIVQELKELLSKTVERCSTLQEQLPAMVPVHQNNTLEERSRRHSVSQEDYDKLEAKHQEAVTMNQRWQFYSRDREKHIQSLTDRIQELSDPHHMTAMIEEATKEKAAQLNMELNRKDAELLEFRKQVSGLSKELTDARKLFNDNSTVEILKQQIQVCTEDFNTERKDREQAVQKARAMQEENARLLSERTNLKKQIELLKKEVEQHKKQPKPPSYEASYSNETSPPPQYVSQFIQGSSMRYPYPYHLVPVQETPDKSSADKMVSVPFADYAGSATASAQDTGYRSPVSQSADMRNYGSLPRPSASNVSRSSTPPASSHNNIMTNSDQSMRNYVSMPRSVALTTSGTSTPSSGGDLSMPPLVRRGGSVKEELPCPKCNNKFSEDVLLSHIEVCTQ